MILCNSRQMSKEYRDCVQHNCFGKGWVLIKNVCDQRAVRIKSYFKLVEIFLRTTYYNFQKYIITL